MEESAGFKKKKKKLPWKINQGVAEILPSKPWHFTFHQAWFSKGKETKAAVKTFEILISLGTRFSHSATSC